MMIVKNKIVLVEDDLLLGGTILEFLQFNFFEVEWFKDGSEALTYFKNNTCDLIISDLMMPSINGEELFLKIHKLLKTESIPFIIISANVDDETRHKQLSLGVNDYILKPFSLSEMLYKVNNFLNFKVNIIKKFRPDPFSKVTIKLSEKNFITSVNEIILKHIKTNINQTELAAQLCISKSTLDKRIRKNTNKNTSKYIREFKLDFSLKMIHSGERNVQYLVEETGFNSFSYFSTSFKEYTAMSPSAYIKEYERNKPENQLD